MVGLQECVKFLKERAGLLGAWNVALG